ncbi:aminopeptidase N [Fulvimarina pelagi HTCC2506]|uniref:Aminopeptidase N n=1 Tax=Fulvimarina pelagi HTCC2506 TaxID=314231 RepID=Q0G5P2_9HYPH|nr:aminopeptidase N [Fulvimarina pelagi]EAU43022.1 aminopeptidase N [Fulvimarina pelagi HTCC2506]
MLRTETGQTVKLADYSETDFVFKDVFLTIRLFEGSAEIDSEIRIERRAGTAPDAPLVLDGDELTLTHLKLNGRAVAEADYDASADRLKVRNLPADDEFVLHVGTRIVPERNTKLMGLYRSNGIWCTQCEAEGFRRITYFYDRPDVLIPYKVRIEAPKDAAPVLLSNGNPGESGDLGDGRHYAVWDDPFKKPSYLFAIVAGDLERIGDSFTTASGTEVTLGIYTDKGKSHQAEYAMDALKRSMAWDERRFGREYDLDVFNIVAIADFNMGAMENKGLNVFNHKYVLLDPDTATDQDYAGVETVIAHEYFHNWTGNRITCRDWFQLCLKEGLTVFRDQEFTADERDRTVQRIGSVRRLKSMQFPEDQGPLQHPVRPGEYREINNFYTATVYDKGAELVRMIATLLGPEDFRKGMDLYFQRHDGDAATIEEFVKVFEDAASTDLSRFALWYHQAGTPTLTITEDYDASDDRYTLTLAQSLNQGAAKTGTEPMLLPVKFGLVGPNGEDRAVSASRGGDIRDDVIQLSEAEESFVFENVGGKPFLSVLRDFSAPVNLVHAQSEADRLALARLDPNPFNRWRTLNDLVGERLAKAGSQTGDQPTDPLGNELVGSIVETAGDDGLDPAFRAQVLNLPADMEIARLIGANVDPDRIHAAATSAREAIAAKGRSVFERLLNATPADARFSPDAASAGKRALANAALGYAAVGEGRPDRAFERIGNASNMTDRQAALAILVFRFPDHEMTQRALDIFYERYESEALVLDKWFALQGAAPGTATLDRIEVLYRHPRFTLKNPNRARSLIGSFAGMNPTAFNRADGRGYAWFRDRLLELDAINPQIAARMATAFRTWRMLEEERQRKIHDVLSGLANMPQLSKDLRDIVDRTLA